VCRLFCQIIVGWTNWGRNSEQLFLFRAVNSSPLQMPELYISCSELAILCVKSGTLTGWFLAYLLFSIHWIGNLGCWKSTMLAWKGMFSGLAGVWLLVCEMFTWMWSRKKTIWWLMYDWNRVHCYKCTTRGKMTVDGLLLLQYANLRAFSGYSFIGNFFSFISLYSQNWGLWECGVLS